MKPRDLLKQIDHDQIIEAIRRAESQTTGEIRVFISHGKPKDPVAAARAEFLRLTMHHAAARNGVLILIAPRSRSVAIVGDTAIHERCGDNQWRQIADGMLAHCRDGKFTQALAHGIQHVANVLAAHFPRSPGSHNELPKKVEQG